MADPVSAFQVATAIVAAAGLALSVFNFFRTSRNADRQHAVAFASDITTWAVSVLRIYRRLGDTRYSELDVGSAADKTRDTLNDLNFLCNEAGLRFARDDSKCLIELRSILQKLTVEHEAVCSGKKLQYQEDFESSQNRFTNFVRDEIGIGKRHFEARKYLA